MQDSNEPTSHPDASVPPQGDAAGDAAMTKPKRTRRPKAVEAGEAVEAPATDVAQPALADDPTSTKPAPRRRKAVTAVLEAPEPAPERVIEIAAEGEAVEDEAAKAATEPKPKRAPRKKATAAVDAIDSFEGSQPSMPADGAPMAPAREPAGDGFFQLGPEVGATDAGRPSALADDGTPPTVGERSPRSADKQDQRGPRDRGARGQRNERPPRAADQSDGQGLEAGGPDAMGVGAADEARDPDQMPSRRAAIAAEQANEVFAELLSGDFDTTRDEVVEEAGEAESDPQKRVLRPEPDAPKLQKVLAQSGVGSRRDIEQMIEDGRITVNGQAAHIGQRVSYGDQVKVGGKPIRIRIAPQPARILAYHKPVGEVVTHDDPQGRPTVFRRLPRLQNGKWMSVGRLDLNTEGLLLFTTSGELANQLMHPRFGVEREYAVRVLGTLPEASKAKLLEGVNIEGQMASFKSIENGGGEGVNHWYRVVITEGRNREVRKLFEAVGLAVSRLIRVRYGAIVLPRGLKRGVWVELGESDVRAVKSLAGFDRPDHFQQKGGRHGKPQPGQHGQPGQGPQQGGGFKNRQPQGGGQDGQGRGGPQGQGGRSPYPNQHQNQNQNQNQQRASRPPLDRPQGGAHAQGDQGDDFDHIGPIPNPLEQTFDKRFAKGSKRITQGFGRPDHNADRGPAEKKGGPRQPDPLQTSVGYIGADAYFSKVGGRSGRGGGGGGNHGGGNHGGGGRGRR